MVGIFILCILWVKTKDSGVQGFGKAYIFEVSYILVMIFCSFHVYEIEVYLLTH
jgi:hypothetical protein